MGCRDRLLYVSDLRTPCFVLTLFKGISTVASFGLAIVGFLSFGNLVKPLEERFERIESPIELCQRGIAIEQSGRSTAVLSKRLVC